LKELPFDVYLLLLDLVSEFSVIKGIEVCKTDDFIEKFLFKFQKQIKLGDKNGKTTDISKNR